MTRLGRDPSGENDMLSPVIFLATFIGIAALLIGYCQSFYATTGESGDWAYETGYDTIGGITYVLLAPEDGYDMEIQTIFTDWDSGNPLNMVFTGDDETIESALVRNDYADASEDGFVFKMSYGWWSVKSTHLSLQEIYDGQMSTSNLSVCDIALGARSYSVFCEVNANYTLFQYMVSLNQYNISVGFNLEDKLTSNSMWTILGQMLTADLPDTHPIINIIIAIPIWTAIGILAFYAIRSVLPF
jgi:hypothetical protein